MRRPAGAGEAPQDWRLPEYQARRAAVLDHLGHEFFFERDRPEQSRRAPDFRQRLATPPAA